MAIIEGTIKELNNYVNGFPTTAKIVVSREGLVQKIKEINESLKVK